MLVLVTGPPGSGKTTIARPLAASLGFPLLAKDTVKEALYRALGADGRASSRRLGAAAYEIMFAVAAESSDAVMEANFDRDVAGPRILELWSQPVEIYCDCPPEEAMRRYQRRIPQRDPRHFDSEMLRELEERLARGSAPLSLGGPVLRVGTTKPVVVEEIAVWIRAQYRGFPPPG